MKEFHSMLIHKNESCDRSCLINFENKELTIRQIDKRRRRQFRAPLAHTHAKQTISTSLLSPPPLLTHPLCPLLKEQTSRRQQNEIVVNKFCQPVKFTLSLPRRLPLPLPGLSLWHCRLHFHLIVQ